MKRVFWFIPVAVLLSACTSAFKKTHSYTVQSFKYKVAENDELPVDVYHTDGAGLKPAVIVVHGGGWRNRRGDMVSLCEDLARSGFTAINITYRLGEKGRYPLAVDDVRTGIRWAMDNSEQLSIDRSRIAGWGYSSGAHLILLAGLDPKTGLKAIVAGGTPSDLTVWPEVKLVVEFMGKKYLENENLWKDASPVNHVDPKSPPVFLYHGSIDWIVEIDQMKRMSDALTAKHVLVETHTVRGLGHMATYYFSRESIDKGTLFLDRFIGPALLQSRK